MSGTGSGLSERRRHSSSVAAQPRGPSSSPSDFVRCCMVSCRALRSRSRRSSGDYRPVITSRRRSSVEMSPPFTSGWYFFTSVSKRALISSAVAPSSTPSVSSERRSTLRMNPALARRLGLGARQAAHFAEHAERIGEAALGECSRSPARHRASRHPGPSSRSAGGRSARPSDWRRRPRPACRRNNYRTGCTGAHGRSSSARTRCRGAAPSARDASPPGRSRPIHRSGLWPSGGDPCPARRGRDRKWRVELHDRDMRVREGRYTKNRHVVTHA